MKIIKIERTDHDGDYYQHLLVFESKMYKYAIGFLSPYRGKFIYYNNQYGKFDFIIAGYGIGRRYKNL